MWKVSGSPFLIVQCIYVFAFPSHIKTCCVCPSGFCDGCNHHRMCGSSLPAGVTDRTAQSWHPPVNGCGFCPTCATKRHTVPDVRNRNTNRHPMRHESSVGRSKCGGCRRSGDGPLCYGGRLCHGYTGDFFLNTDPSFVLMPRELRCFVVLGLVVPLFLRLLLK